MRSLVSRAGRTSRANIEKSKRGCEEYVNFIIEFRTECKLTEQYLKLSHQASFLFTAVRNPFGDTDLGYVL